jgi:hypothetical protein
MEAPIVTDRSRERLAYAAQAGECINALLLEQNDVALLDRILSNHLVELHSEIGHTDSYDLRQALKQDRVAVLALVQQLRALAAGAAPLRAD